jgi:RNA polymerase sigma factor (sigma-70 family)
MSTPSTSEAIIMERVASVSFFIRCLARRYSQRFLVDAEDLRQEGTLRAIHLATIFKDGMGCTFWSYSFKALIERMRTSAVKAAKKVSCTHNEYFFTETKTIPLDAPPFPGHEDNSVMLELQQDSPVHDALHAADARRIIASALQDLTPRERSIITARFMDARTLQDIGAELDMSGENVRKIERAALMKLRAHPHIKALAA